MASRKRKANGKVVENHDDQKATIIEDKKITAPLSAREALAKRQQNDAIAMTPIVDSTKLEDSSISNQDLSMDYDSEAGMSDEAASAIDAELLNMYTEPAHDALLSTWTATAENYSQIGPFEERVKLAYNDTLSIVGQYSLKVVYGVISVYGAILTSKSPLEQIIAPSTEFLPTIRCVSGDWAEIALFSISASEDLERLERVNPVFGGIWKCRCSKCAMRLSQRTYSKLRRTSDYHQNKPVFALNVPADWYHFLPIYEKQLMSSSRPKPVAVVGLAGSETTTFIQWMINSILARSNDTTGKSIILLDLDSDNPLIGLPGHITLSVLSRPLLQPRWVRCNIKDQQDHIVNTYAIGAGNRRNEASMTQYAPLLLAEAEKVWNTKTHGSFLVNLPVCSQSVVGLSLLKTLGSLGIDDLITIGAASSEKLRNQNINAKLTITSLSRLQQLPRGLTAKHVRSMSIQSYFHRFQSDGKLNHTPISSWRPRAVSYKLAERYKESDYQVGHDFLCVGFPNDLPPMYPLMLHDLLNGTLLTIMVLNSDEKVVEEAIVKRGIGDDIPYINSPLIQQPGKRFAGLALIRSIDVEHQMLHLIAPESTINIIPNLSLLIADVVDSPTWAYEEDLHFRQWSKRTGETSASSLFADTQGQGGYPWIEAKV